MRRAQRLAVTYLVRLVAWVGKLLATGMGGPGIAVIGDPGLNALSDAAPPPGPPVPITGWQRRARVLAYEAAPLGAALLVVLFLTGVPFWPLWVLGLGLVLLPFVWRKRSPL